MELKDGLPLVTIGVVTYNSAKTIIETLDSIFNQTYSNIELIVSDDCSFDNTVQLCKEWIINKGNRFVRTLIITSETNTGLVANNNRAIRNAEGEWIKLFAGDDLLLSTAIEEYVKYVTHHAEANVIFSRIQPFISKGGVNTYIGDTIPPKPYERCFQLEPKEQYSSLLEYNYVPSPSMFISKEFAISDIFDNRYPAMEDYPAWIKLTKENTKLHFIPQTLVLYRRGEGVTSSHTNTFINKKYKDSYKRFYYGQIDVNLEGINKEKSEYYRRLILLDDIAFYVLKNKKNILTKLIYNVIKKLILPK